MTDVHLSWIVSSNLVTSWMAEKLLQAIDPGSWISRVCHFMNRSFRPIMDKDAAALRIPSSFVVWIIFSLIVVCRTWYKKVPCSQSGLIRHKYTHTYLVMSFQETTTLWGYEGMSFTFSDASVSGLDAVSLRSPQESTIAKIGPSWDRQGTL